MIEVIVVAAVILFSFGLPAFIMRPELPPLPDWANPMTSKRRHRKQALEYIEWKRDQDLRVWRREYADEDEWNRKELESAISMYESHPRMFREQMLDDRNRHELLRWVRKNDPAAMKSRIRELEKELDMK